MKQKIFLTSVIAMGFVAPAMATPSNTGTFPQDGLMQEDYTYTNAATSTNMDGVYSGTVNAEAQYSDILYTIGAGKYLPAGAEAVIDCNVPGSYCPGLQSQVTYDANNNQGLTSCSTVGDGSYTLSDGTGSANTSCYKTCSASCTQPSAPAHSTNVSYGTETASGNQYYGSSCNAVAPTCSINFDCVNGYHKRPDLTMEEATALFRLYIQQQGGDPNELSQAEIEAAVNELFGNWGSLPDVSKGQIISAIAVSRTVQGPVGNVDLTGVDFWQPYINLNQGILNQNTNGIYINGYSYYKNENGVETCQEHIGNWAGYRLLTGGNEIDCDVAVQRNAELAVFRQLAQDGDWFVSIPNREVSMAGHSRCDYSGTRTPCRNKYTMINGITMDTMEVDGSDMLWEEGTGQCESRCAYEAVAWSPLELMLVSEYVSDTIEENYNTETRVQEIGNLLSSINNSAYGSISVGNIPYVCNANTITINWDGASATEINANNAGTATYGSDIRTPRSATPVPGKTFTGWRFSAPQQASVQEP